MILSILQYTKGSMNNMLLNLILETNIQFIRLHRLKLVFTLRLKVFPFKKKNISAYYKYKLQSQRKLLCKSTRVIKTDNSQWSFSLGIEGRLHTKNLTYILYSVKALWYKLQ
jgi:hypothetical protein